MTDTADQQPTIVDLDPTDTMVVRGVVSMADLPGFFDRSFGALAAALERSGEVSTGAAFALYHGAPGEVADLEVGFPVAGPVAGDGEVEPGSLPGGPVARFVHRGAFDGLGPAWGRLAEWIVEQGRTPAPDLWEVYLTEPSPDMDPADLRTELNWPLVD